MNIKTKTTDIGHFRKTGLPHGMEPNFVCGIYIISDITLMSTVDSIGNNFGSGGDV
jgi:hypothetical protein